MLNPLVTNVLAADRRRRLRHEADTARLTKSATVTDAGATPLPRVAERSTRKTTLGASLEAVVP